MRLPASRKKILRHPQAVRSFLMKQVIEAPFHQMKPENSSALTDGATISSHGDTRDAFEHARAELLSVTNYLEALYAQIQRAARGGHNLSLVTDTVQANDGQSFS
jgi:hypothetical protein